LGSGLGALANSISKSTIIPYARIPHFPKSAITFHEGNLLIGEWAKKTVFIMQGRFHYYEGHPMSILTLPIRIMHQCGVHTLIVTNAAGSLQDEIKVGSIAVIYDHINLMGSNPLIGLQNGNLGERFPDLTDAYHRDLIELVKRAAFNKYKIYQVVYAAITGPSLPTAAEIKMLRMFGADIVGMSTVPEVLVARQLGIKVLALSVITDQAMPQNISKVLPKQIKTVTLKYLPRIKELLSGILVNL
jgi:purine-nucleoside phosphorylase